MCTYWLVVGFLESHSLSCQDEGLFIFFGFLIHICKLNASIDALFIHLNSCKEALFGGSVSTSG
jgi:hypothetical protein